MTDNKLLANYNYSFGNKYQPFLTRAQAPNTNTIGVIVSNIESYFTSSVLKGIGHIASEAGFELIITNSQGSEEKEIANARLLLNNGIGGVIALPCRGTNKMLHFNAFKRVGIPIILFDQVQQHGQSDTIVTDHRGCGYTATEHLVMQGCRQISMVTNSINTDNNLQYYKGYQDALQKHNIQCNPAILMPGATPGDAGLSAAGYIMQMNPRPDGLFFTNDIEAASCMHALQEAGVSIPQDIAIVASGNTPISRLVSPALTTIDYAGYEAGKAAATAMFNHLNGRRVLVQHKITVIPTNLIVRNSSLKVPHANV